MTIKNKRKRRWTNRSIFNNGGIWEQIKDFNKATYKPLLMKDIKELLTDLENDNKE